MTPSDASNSPVREVRWVDKTAIVDVEGEIDLNCSQAFQLSLLEVLDQEPERVVINLAGVRYMDSSGIASLVKLLSRVRKSQLPLSLVSLTDRVRGVFEITRLDNVFDIYATEQEALA